MPISWFPRRGISRRLITAALAALLAFATLTFVPGTAAHGQVQPDPPDTCGVDVLFVLDASGSMGYNGNEGINAVRAGVLAFLAELETEAPASTVALMRFGTVAGDTLDYTNVGDPALANWMNNVYDDYTDPDYYTNWDDALGTAASAFAAADDVILITDGNPTTSGDGTVIQDDVDGWNAFTADAIASADTLKAQTINTVWGIGAGADFTGSPTPGDPVTPLGRLQQVVDSGSVTTFEDLTDALPDLIGEICAPTITIDKTATPTELPGPGGEFEFTVTVENTSPSGADVRLTKLTDQIDGQAEVNIVDLDGVSCVYDADQSPYNPETDWIDVDASVSCTWTRVLTGGPQSEHDVATAAGVDPGNRPTNEPTDDETITITDLPSAIDIEKSGSLVIAGSTPQPGDVIEYTFDIENTGQDLLNDVTLNDDLTDDEYIDWTTSSDPNTPDGSLSPGETVTGFGTYTITQDDIDNGNVPNCATTTGTPVGGQPVEDEDCTDTPIEDAPGISVVKTSDKSEVIAVDTVEFTIEITNTGNVTLSNLVVDDVLSWSGGSENLPQCESPSTTTLAPNASTTITCEQELDSTTYGDGVTNTVDVTAEPPTGPPVTDTDDTPVNIVPPNQFVGGDACVSDPIPGYGFTLDQPVFQWESTGWGPTFDPTQDTLQLHIWMNTQDPDTDPAAIVYDVPWTSDLLGEAPFASAAGAPPADMIVFDGDQGYLTWPGYDKSGWTGPENGLEGIVFPGDDWRPAYFQFQRVAQTDVESVPYPTSTQDCAPGGALDIEKLVGPLGTPAGSPDFVDIYNRPSNETAVTWQITLKNLTDYALFDVVMTDAATPACEAAFDAAVQKNNTGNFMDPQEEIVITCDDTIGQFVAKINLAVASATDAWGQPVKQVQDDAATQSVLASGQIGDTVWADENKDGKQDDGEKGIAGAIVRLTLPDGSQVDTITNSDGKYLFSALPAGTYTATLILSSIPKPVDGDLELTTPGSFTINLADGESYLDADFGVASTLPITGFSSVEIALIGLFLLVAGATAVLLTRRSNEGPEEMAA